MTTPRRPARFLPADRRPAPVRSLALTVALLAASAASAQPAAGRIVRAWAEAQREARGAAGIVRFVEHAEREVDGPAVARRIESETEVTLGRGRPQRRVRWAAVDGEEIRPERLDALERRMAEAMGPAVLWGQRPPLPALLEALEPSGDARATELDGRPAWLVAARSRAGRPPDRPPGPPRGGRLGRRPDGPPRGPLPDGRATLWFSREPGPPRLLRARFERPLPDGGSATLDATFVPVGPLDLPARHHAEAVVRQRRRLRLFTVLLRSDVAYTDHVVGR